MRMQRTLMHLGKPMYSNLKEFGGMRVVVHSDLLSVKYSVTALRVVAAHWSEDVS